MANGVSLARSPPDGIDPVKRVLDSIEVRGGREAA